MKYTHNKQNGFTLIEIMVVMVILAALIVITASTFQSSQMRSRDVRRKSDLKQIANALEAYYNDYGSYPASSSSYRILGCGTAGSEQACNPGNAFALTNASGSVTNYMVQIPDDPRGGEYIYVSDTESYQLFARLENHTDAQVRNPDDSDPNTDASKDVYADYICSDELGCNFGISSSNISLDAVIN